MTYNPKNPVSREALAVALRSMLSTAGFTLLTEGKYAFIQEEVYARKISNTITELVFTTICNGRARYVGTDAIRVFAVLKENGRESGYVKTIRVNRVGQIPAICDRTLKAMREVYKAARKRAA